MFARSLFELFKSRLSRPTSRRSRRAAGRRLVPQAMLLEVLEDRRLLTFNLAVNYAAGTNPQAIVSADFNNDTVQDLAVANYDSGNVSVLLGNADGTFQPAQNSATGAYPRSLAVGDLNADGKLDLVTTSGGIQISVLRGNGDGTFQPAQNTNLNYETSSLAVGDLNADGKLDLVATSNEFTCTSSGYYGCYDGFWTGHVNVLLGHGGGAFTAPITSNLAAGSYLTGVATGKFNADGFPDVAVTDSNNNTLSVLINDQSWPPLPPPTVSINDVTVTEGNTGSVNATFTLSLSYAHDVAVTVYYATANVTATADSDYTATSGNVIFAIGETTKPITVAVTGDRLAEPTENFFVNLSAPNNATIGDGQGIGTVLDDEPRISINDVTVTEGNTGTVNATFKVTLSAAYDEDVIVPFTTTNGSATAGDYTTTSGTVTIAVGLTSNNFTVAVIGDRIAEPTENFFVNLSAPSNAAITDGQGAGTILDNEPRISINNVSKLEGNGKGTTLFVFTVTLSAAYDQAVTVNYATADGTATTANRDYQAKTGTLTFAPGVTSMTITIAVYRDKTVESNETFFVDLSGPSLNALFTNMRGIGTILDDDRR